MNIYINMELWSVPISYQLHEQAHISNLMQYCDIIRVITYPLKINQDQSVFLKHDYSMYFNNMQVQLVSFIDRDRGPTPCPAKCFTQIELIALLK